MRYETEKKAAAKMPLKRTIGYTKQRMAGGKNATERNNKMRRNGK